MEGQYVETPGGLFTASGTWFRIRVAELQTYAGPLLDRIALPTLLAQAECWVRSPVTVALWALPALLWVTSPLLAALATLGIYGGWALLSPAVVSPGLVRVCRVLSYAGLQGLYYVVVLSLLAMEGRMAALWTGLAGFILLRWGLLPRLLAAPLEALHRRLYPLPRPDQVLRAMIVRWALKYRLSLPELDRMEQRMLEIFNYRKPPGS